MMTLIRAILGKLILFLNFVFSPSSLQRPAEKQALVDEKAKKLALYQFQACPFCVKVRRAMKRLNLNIELRNARDGTPYADELLKEGGELQVPCLRIQNSNGSIRWMYESSDIIKYLETEFSV